MLFITWFFLYQDKRISRNYGYSVRGTPPVVRDYSYSRWSPRFSVIFVISSEGLVANYVLPLEQRFDNNAFIEFLDVCLLPVMNVYNGVNARSVIVMGKIQQLIQKISSEKNLFLFVFIIL